MEVVHVRCAGLDVSKKDAKVCVRVAGAGRRKTVETVTTWASMTTQVLALREHLIAEQVTCVRDGGDWGLLEAVLLPPGGRRVRGDVGQRPAREEPTWPQERRVRRDVAGPARCSRTGPQFVRYAATATTRDTTVASSFAKSRASASMSAVGRRTSNAASSIPPLSMN